MIRRPRSLFRARRRGRPLYVGPHVAGRRPYCLVDVEREIHELGSALEEPEAKLDPESPTHITIFHADDCAVFAGRECGCEPKVFFHGVEDTSDRVYPGPEW
jgi:hypothetical protein